MSWKRLALILTTALLASNGGAAEDLSNEVDTTVGLYRYRSGYHPGFFFGLGGLGAGFGHRLTDWLEVSSRVQFQIFSDNGQNPGGSVVNAWVGPTFNSSSRIEEAFFLSAGVGINYSRVNDFTYPGTLFSVAGESATNFAYALE